MSNDRSHEIVQMFYLTQGELDKGNAWTRAHDKEKHIPRGKKRRDVGAIGGAYTWCFTPTGIGVACTVKCACGDKIDITNYDLW
jgi:hypothetical protein